MFIDDLNMTSPDECGDQPPLELLRFIIENKGFYDIKKLLLVKIK